MHTVGAGGGSIARVDAGGLLHVGPESAGADPGPACYGRGGPATVTDANLILGRLDAERFLGGRMQLDVAAAEREVDRIADQLGLSRMEAAAGIVRVADAAMEGALRLVSVEAGYDPRDFALLSFGGAGGLHACSLANALGIGKVLIPPDGGVLSARGIVEADRIRDYSQGMIRRLDSEAAVAALRLFGELEERTRAEFGGDAGRLVLERSVDLRWQGQSFELEVPLEKMELDATDLERIVKGRFADNYEQRYGYRFSGRAIEVVSVRLRAKVLAAPVAEEKGAAAIEAVGKGQSADKGEGVRLDRAALPPGTQIAGPALVLEDHAASWIAAGWTARAMPSGLLMVEAG